MIRYQDMPIGSKTSVARFYAEDDPEPMADYDVVCTVNWEPPATAWLHGMMGKGSRRLWRELAESLHERKIEFIRAFRVEGRLLPGAELMPDGSWRIPVAQFVRKPVDTNFAAL